MAHLTCTFSSEYLRMNTSITVVLPEQQEMRETKVVYLLHGLMDNCSGWSRYSAVERYAREHNVALIMPEVQRSFYTDMELGLSYFSYVLKELPFVCQRFFGFSKEKQYSYIMGLSMGGYGALKCVFTRPEQYAGCAVFSSVTDLPGRVVAAEKEEVKEFQAIFGVALRVPEKDDLFSLVEKADISALPPIYMACGEGDELYPENVRLAEKLKERKACALFEHWEGIHDWVFWDRAVERGMDLMFGKSTAAWPK